MAFAGCLSGNESTEPETQTAVTPNQQPTQSRHKMDFAHVSVEKNVTSPVTINPACRNRKVTIGPGRSTSISRDEVNEECQIELELENKTIYSRFVEDKRKYYLTVKENGTVDESPRVR